MSPVNLRVPNDASKNLEELKKKMPSHNGNVSGRSSISLRIPNRSFASISELTSSLNTPTDTPAKPENSPKSPTKNRLSKRIIKTVSFKSVHHRKLKKGDAKSENNPK